MELRETTASLKALQLVSEFSSYFKDIRYTLHPPDIPGEVAGKGSNVAWATRSVWMALRPTESIGRFSVEKREAKVDDRERTVITIMDSDSESLEGGDVAKT
jgi:hypothetical protein